MTSRRFLPALLLLFIGSGCAALIYEIVWFQLLQLVIGSSAISLGVLLGTFMGGMCLGSFVLSSVVPARHHPLRVYAGLELGIALIGLLVLVGMPLVSGIYTSWAGSGVAGLLFRGVIASVCLLPPTLLMGATLPAISRWVEATPEGVSWLGFFYGGNIAGGSLVREWAAAHPEAQAIFHSWWSSERVVAAAKEVDPEPSHANWFENFPWTRLEGVELPQARKPPLDEAAYRVASPEGVRELLGDGVFAGAYEQPDEQVEAVWRAGVDEVRELLENAWR